MGHGRVDAKTLQRKFLVHGPRVQVVMLQSCSRKKSQVGGGCDRCEWIQIDKGDYVVNSCVNNVEIMYCGYNCNLICVCVCFLHWCVWKFDTNNRISKVLFYLGGH